MSTESTGTRVLKTLIQVSAQEIGEETIFGSYKQVLGLIFKQSLTVALGPFWFIFPVTDIVSLLTKIGIESARAFRATNGQSSFIYEMTPLAPGSVHISSMGSEIADDFPLALPEHCVVTSYELPKFQQSITGICATSPLQVHDETPYWCSYCSQYVLGTGMFAIGHTAACILNPHRERFWCDECHTDLTREMHWYTCSQLTRCRFCHVPLPTNRHKRGCPLRK